MKQENTNKKNSLFDEFKNKENTKKGVTNIELNSVEGLFNYSDSDIKKKQEEIKSTKKDFKPQNHFSNNDFVLDMKSIEHIKHFDEDLYKKIKKEIESHDNKNLRENKRLSYIRRLQSGDLKEEIRNTLISFGEIKDPSTLPPTLKSITIKIDGLDSKLEALDKKVSELELSIKDRDEQIIDLMCRINVKINEKSWFARTGEGIKKFFSHIFW